MPAVCRETRLFHLTGYRVKIILKSTVAEGIRTENRMVSQSRNEIHIGKTFATKKLDLGMWSFETGFKKI